MNRVYLDTELSKSGGHLSYIEEHYNVFFLRIDEQFEEEFLLEKFVKTTVQILHYEGFFENFDNADEVHKDCLLFERRRVSLRELNHDVIR